MHRRWLILIVLVLARTAMGFQYQSVGSAAPELRHALGIGFAEIGTLIGLYHITGVLLSFPAGLIIRWTGEKRLCAAGLALMAVGGFVMTEAGGYGLAFSGRLLSGIGGTLFNIVILKMTADWFARREIVLAMAAMMATWPFGIALGLLVQPALAVASGWQAVMLSAAAATLLSLFLIVVFYRPPAAETGGGTDAAFQLPARPVLVPLGAAGLAWGLFNAGLVGYFSFVPALIAEQHHLTASGAGAITSIALWIAIVSIPVGGLLAQRWNRPGITVLLFSSGCGLMLAALATGAPPLLACIVFGLALGPPPGVLTALPAQILPPAGRAAGLGLFWTINSSLQALGPMIMGLVRDQAGGEPALLCAAAAFLAVPALVGVFAVLVRRSRLQPAMAR